MITYGQFAAMEVRAVDDGNTSTCSHARNTRNVRPASACPFLFQPGLTGVCWQCDFWFPPRPLPCPPPPCRHSGTTSHGIPVAGAASAAGQPPYYSEADNEMAPTSVYDLPRGSDPEISLNDGYIPVGYAVARDAAGEPPHARFSSLAAGVLRPVGIPHALLAPSWRPRYPRHFPLNGAGGEVRCAA